MAYFALQPEVAGGLGENTVLDASTHPPAVSKLHYSFDGWLGDELLESFPCYIVTARLRDVLEQATATGCKFADVEVTKSETFEELYPGRALPEFFWLQVDGRAGADDFGVSEDFQLVVSQPTLLLMQSKANLSHCDIEPYA